MKDDITPVGSITHVDSITPDDKGFDYIAVPLKDDHYAVAELHGDVHVAHRSELNKFMQDQADAKGKTLNLRTLLLTDARFHTTTTYWPKPKHQEEVRRWQREATTTRQSHPDYPIEDWRDGVAKGGTVLGYREWMMAIAKRRDNYGGEA
jgi:hypothetical protein